MDRNKIIVRTSIVGIAVNIVLVIFKSIVGALTGSIAVILDAVNNLSDAMSSVITIIGTRIAAKKADKEHPFGYGRVEYITSAIISAIVLTAGITSLKESVIKTIHPERADYTVVSVIIIAAGVIAKLLVGRYVKGIGEKYNSGALKASGADALSDAVLSVSTLVAALISMTMHITLEGIIGVVISIMILRAGYEMLSETMNSIVGERSDPDVVKAIKSKVNRIEGVNGTYDVVLHTYGPENTICSLHVEVSDTMSGRDIAILTRKIQAVLGEEYKGMDVTVGIYASNEVNPFEREVKKDIYTYVKDIEGIMGAHGIYIDYENKTISFDIVVDFDFDTEPLVAVVKEHVENNYPEYTAHISTDTYWHD